MPYPGLLHAGPLLLWQATADVYLRLRHSNQIWLSLCDISWCTQGFVCALQESVSPVLCKFWWFYGGVNGDLLQEGLCHTLVYCTQSPCPCSSPLLNHTSTENTQTQFCLSLCGVSGSWCAQGLFEPSEHLWLVWGLILTMISPLLLSCWGFSFALGHGVSSQSRSRANLAATPVAHSCCSRAYLLAGASLHLDKGYLLKVITAPHWTQITTMM